MDDPISRQASIGYIDRVRTTGMGKKQSLEYIRMYIEKLPSAQPDLQPTCNQLATDCISRQAAIDALGDKPLAWTEGEYELGLQQQWKADVNAIKALPSAQPEQRCLNCGRTINNGGWYEDGRTRCPIEEHYALPKDGYCHLWEKKKVWEDDYVKSPEEGEK